MATTDRSVPRADPTAVPRGYTVGGQALVEGVLMRGPDRAAMAARRPDGTISVRVVPLPGWARPFASVPLVRGVVALAESVHLGVGALQWSASVADQAHRSRRATAGSMLGAVVALVAAFSFFTAVPAVVAAWTIPIVGPVGRTVVEGTLGLAMLVGYIGAVRRHPLVLRTFGYHGAEHKAVATYESGEALDVAAADRFSTRHERCGTTFMLDVAVLSALLHMATNSVWPTGLPMVAARVVTIPLVAGIAYEVLRATAGGAGSRWARTLSRPGMWLQSLTTAEPDPHQLEVALIALSAALPTCGGSTSLGLRLTSTAPSASFADAQAAEP